MADGPALALSVPKNDMTDAPQASLLVVDDDPDILRVVRFYLSKHRYHIETADNGQQALALLKRNPTIELILSDVMMPEMNGLELLKSIRADPELSDIPVILISAEGETSKKVAGLNLGADDFITKPFNFDELTARVRNHLRLRKLQREVLVANELLRQQNIRFQEDMEAARTVQMAMLPAEFPISTSFRLGYRYLPMERVGGDFFDVVLLGQGSQLGVLVADVCGHGIAAALITAMTKITFRSSCYNTVNPAVVLEAMNRALIPNIKNGYVTAYYGVIDVKNHEFTYASGGHPPLLVHRRAQDQIMMLQPQSTFLGTFEGVRFQSDVLPLQVGDRILFYTDGLYESRTESNQYYGHDRFVQVVQRNGALGIQPLLDKVVEDWMAFMGGVTPGDDITLVGLDVLE
jgi:phosphoserine phosphatase RsbU/P